MESYRIENIKDFWPEHVFECGQCFRWERQEDGSYTGIAKGKIVNVRFEPETPGSPDSPAAQTGALVITPCSKKDWEEIWRPYFDMDRDYAAIKKTLIDGDDTPDHVMEKATEYGYGIRILDQDLWETIVSFIISQNNNIPRIKGCIERLAENFGEEIGLSAYDIPSPEKLASLTVEDLAPVRLGYRARYLIETAKSVIENGLPETFDDLSKLCGVGPKVANCISLFGMNGYASFPIDVWVIKVMHELYGLPEGDKKAMAAFAKEKFGDLGGFAQQYLFYYMRDREQ